ncbi:MAG: hypothetical protein F6K56_14905 [Moorea sp. SIO3G5]|nr:hypothetical protein [Moorena sp. SIO3G5]
MFPGLLAFRPRYANGHPTLTILPDGVGDSSDFWPISNTTIVNFTCTKSSKSALMHVNFFLLPLA